ncbi:MAG: 16S rRNA (adenine(1518)-N(6)/adenine(1519)-N(6))-dimethyltransferase RsmA [Candidatus Thermoplasmatota archaeon]|nr:16S rRNA (adenine(1518)-N(6)/adenine(1519)-N(6))-dimethyltransferase RsmA [Candidatus Thermoplasmatota archaeon]
MALKKLGQNFLIDEDVAKREIKYCNITKDDVVLEIGPGKGVLTALLARRARKVIAVEIDKRFIDDLKKNLPKNVLLICADVLKVDFKTLPKFNKIVSNLPYQISSPITFKLLEYDFSQAILIYQKEFADRMVAKVGSKNYSRLSVGIYYTARCEIVETVPKTCFDPQPKVESCIVNLLPRTSHPFSVSNENFFFELTRELFNHRRKKIKNILQKTYGVDCEEIPGTDKRVEELTPEQIGKLSNTLLEIQHM